MKKIALFAIIGALALTMTSCHPKGQTGNDGNETEENGSEENGSDKVEAVYNDETYDIEALEIIDPNDEEAYKKYGGKYDDEDVPASNPSNDDVPTGPSDVDMVNVKITDTAHVTMLLDQFDYDINRMRELVKDRQANAAEIEKLTDHIIKITEKMNEGAEAGHCTEAQLERYQKQADKFLSIVNNQ